MSVIVPSDGSLEESIHGLDGAQNSKDEKEDTSKNSYTLQNNQDTSSDISFQKNIDIPVFTSQNSLWEKHQEDSLEISDDSLDAQAATSLSQGGYLDNMLQRPYQSEDNANNVDEAKHVWTIIHMSFLPIHYMMNKKCHPLNQANHQRIH